MKKTITLLSLCVPVILGAQPFTGLYTFANVTTTTGTTDPTPPPTAIGLTFGSFTAVGTNVNPNANGRFSFVNWPTGATNANDNYSSLTGSINPAEYYEVTLTPSVGYAINLSGITFTVQRSGFGIRTYAVRSSLDGFANNLSATISPANLNLSVQPGNIFFWNFDAQTAAQNGSTITLGGPQFAGLTSPVTFRFYAWNSESGTGTFSIDNVTFAGNATALQILTAFTASPSAVCDGTPVQFTDNSQSFNGPLATWSWNFGDPASGTSDTSTLQNPAHTFTTCGTYTVTLISANSNNNSDTAQNVITVFCNPIASFSGNPTTGCGQTCVNFTDNSTGNPAAWTWDFGDASTGSVQNPNHCYANAGMYSVTLTVMNANGCAGSVTMNNYITVYPAVIADFTFTTSGLTANFTDISSGGSGPFSVTFNPGDGSPPLPFVPSSYNYPFDNNWQACLTVTDANGCTSSTCHFVNIVTTSVKDRAGADFFTVSPNPSFDGIFFVRAEACAQARVYNALGDLIFSGEENSASFTLDMSKQPVGIYFLELLSGEHTLVKKIVLQR